MTTEQAAGGLGRVDEDGTVWAHTGGGERVVGSYPGVPADEALGYFSRKFEEIEGQVALLEQRVQTTDLAAKEAFASVEKLRAAIAEGHALGDLDGLLVRLLDILTTVQARRAEQESARARARDEARARKEAIVAEAEQLATSSSWKATGDRLRALLDRWKAEPRLDRRTDDELWKRFSAARTAFDKHRRQHFAALDEQRQASAQRKERLVVEAESLAGSTEWGPTATRYRELMAEWKAAGRAGREAEDALWARFRQAQDAFFGSRSAAFQSRNAVLRDNLAAKEALVAEAERLLPVGDPRAARAALRSVQERFEAVGAVPRDAKDRVEGRLRAVEDAVRSAEETRWRRANPEARARAEATAAQLRASISALEGDLERARAAGDSRAASAAEEAAVARRAWLAEAEKHLS